MVNDRGTELAEQHWKYIENILRIHGIDEAEITRIGFHYKQVMKYGYKHGISEKEK